MNIAFFLLPKDEVIYLSPRSTMRQALERMERHRYSAIPLVDQNGKYAGTITEGDLLWKMKNTPGLTFANAHTVRLDQIEQHVKNQPVHIHADMEDLINLAMEQNFVPVIDDKEVFIGIVRRKEIIEYCAAVIRREELRA
ncbi:CBS domain-containing protein [[Clostridium] ultunense Esp]|uniref:CBS domain-containing protein n=1 Tax=Thermicanus aegyptius TaxID=94009 RepID=UPI0002B70FC6|nr:CBS domain-containing protein [Thermicanus aegyptius]CCQ92413.1 CBS domain-containing protein [[Clostridium] ultunense Esp]